MKYTRVKIARNEWNIVSETNTVCNWNPLTFKESIKVLKMFNAGCVSCGKITDDLFYDTDPFAEEIHDDHTLMVQCANCSHESAMDI